MASGETLRAMPVDTALSDPRLAMCSRGVVWLCRCCGEINLRFNGTELVMSRDELGRMCDTLDQMCIQARRPGVVWAWKLTAETATRKAVFELRNDDPDTLAGLLHEAEATLRLDTMLLDVLGPRASS